MGSRSGSACARARACVARSAVKEQQRNSEKRDSQFARTHPPRVLALDERPRSRSNDHIPPEWAQCPISAVVYISAVVGRMQRFQRGKNLPLKLKTQNATTVRCRCDCRTNFVEYCIGVGKVQGPERDRFRCCSQGPRRDIHRCYRSMQQCTWAPLTAVDQSAEQQKSQP